MGDDALIKNVFGSDSDSDDDAAAAAPPAAAPTEDAGAAKGDGAEGEVHADADPIPEIFVYGPPVRTVRSYDRIRVSKIVKIISKIKILQIFGGLVFGCIKTKFCKKI